MNEQKLTKYLASYKEWLTQNPSAATEVLRIHEALQFVNESINRLGLVPNGL